MAPPGVSIIPLLEALVKVSFYRFSWGAYVVRRSSRRDEDIFVVIFDLFDVYGLPSPLTTCVLSLITTSPEVDRGR